MNVSPLTGCPFWASAVHVTWLKPSNRSWHTWNRCEVLTLASKLRALPNFLTSVRTALPLPSSPPPYWFPGSSSHPPSPLPPWAFAVASTSPPPRGPQRPCHLKQHPSLSLSHSRASFLRNTHHALSHLAYLFLSVSTTEYKLPESRDLACHVHH